MLITAYNIVIQLYVCVCVCVCVYTPHMHSFLKYSFLLWFNVGY